METRQNHSAVPELLKPLTSIRGIAALVVVLYHLRESFPRVLALSWAPVHGELAVDLFFVLSGFILTHVYNQEFTITIRSAMRFYIARLARIYPLHLVTLLATLLAVSVSPSIAASFRADFFGLKAFILNLFLVQNWGLVDISWNAVSWSISAEWFMYLWFPFVLAILRFRNSNAGRCLTWLLVLFAIHLCLIEYRGMSGYGGMCLGGMMRVAFEFTYGMLAYQLRATYARYLFRSQVFAVSTAVACLALWEQSVWFLFVPASIVILLHLSVTNGRTFHLMSNNWLVWLGEISYSLYMWHWIVIQFTKRRLDLFPSGQLTASLFVLVLLLILIAIAAASNLVIEKPTRRIARRLSALDPKLPTHLLSSSVKTFETQR